MIRSIKITLDKPALALDAAERKAIEKAKDALVKEHDCAIAIYDGVHELLILHTPKGGSLSPELGPWRQPMPSPAIPGRPTMPALPQDASTRRDMNARLVAARQEQARQDKAMTNPTSDLDLVRDARKEEGTLGKAPHDAPQGEGNGAPRSETSAGPEPAV